MTFAFGYSLRQTPYLGAALEAWIQKRRSRAALFSRAARYCLRARYASLRRFGMGKPAWSRIPPA